MSIIQPKPKTVNLAKLQGLSDIELEERINKAPEKVAKKKERYEVQHKLNMARLSAYQTYREQDAEACRKILQQRKQKQSLPSGNGRVA